jgi:hypothetical protein
MLERNVRLQTLSVYDILAQYVTFRYISVTNVMLTVVLQGLTSSNWWQITSSKLFSVSTAGVHKSRAPGVLDNKICKLVPDRIFVGRQHGNIGGECSRIGCWGRLGHRRKEVTREWRRLRQEELKGLYYSPSVVRVIKLRRMRWAGRVARMAKRKGA